MWPVILKRFEGSRLLEQYQHPISGYWTFDISHSAAQAQNLNAHINSSCCWDRSLCPATETFKRRTAEKKKHFHSHRSAKCHRLVLNPNIRLFWKKKKKNLSNGRQSVTCFKCKPASLKHFCLFSSDIMLKPEEKSSCHLQILSLVSLSKQVKPHLKQVKRSHPGGTFVFFGFRGGYN